MSVKAGDLVVDLGLQNASFNVAVDQSKAKTTQLEAKFNSARATADWLDDEMYRLSNSMEVQAKSAKHALETTTALDRGMMSAGRSVGAAGRMSGSTQAAIGQLVYAIDDASSVTGDWSMRLRAAGNNLSSVAMLMGGPFGAAMAVALIAGTQLYNVFSKQKESLDALKDRAKEYADELDRIASHSRGVVADERQIGETEADTAKRANDQKREVEKAAAEVAALKKEADERERRLSVARSRKQAAEENAARYDIVERNLTGPGAEAARQQREAAADYQEALDKQTQSAEKLAEAEGRLADERERHQRIRDQMKESRAQDAAQAAWDRQTEQIAEANRQALEYNAAIDERIALEKKAEEEQKRVAEEGRKAQEGLRKSLFERYGDPEAVRRQKAADERKQALSELNVAGYDSQQREEMRRRIEAKYQRDLAGSGANQPARELGSLEAGSRQVADMMRRAMNPGSMKDKAAELAAEQLAQQKQIAENTKPKPGMQTVKIGMGT